MRNQTQIFHHYMRIIKITLITLTFLILSASPPSLIAQNSSEPPTPSHDSSSVIPANDSITISSVETWRAASPVIIALALQKGLYYKNISRLQDSLIAQKDSIISSFHSLITSSLIEPPVYKTSWALTALCTSAALILNWTIFLLINHIQK